ncbi:MAG: hypothetical protein LBU83_13830 [Bacteroidales bacterium]|nr:hypothetical protein [Bacteroidales bacterium]
MFILEELLQVDDARRKILDTLNIGKLKDKESYCIDCYEKDKEEYEDKIIAIVISQTDMDNPYHDTIVKAWRLNVRTGQFEPIKNHY